MYGSVALVSLSGSMVITASRAPARGLVTTADLSTTARTSTVTRARVSMAPLAQGL